jgi:tRNA pseudouridine38-40 synthase
MAGQHSIAPRLQPPVTTAVTKLKLILAYDGTNYAGWQLQKIGTGVQELVEQALSKLIPGTHRLHSSSRTDTGVHALGMVAHVELPKARLRMKPEKLRLALNAHLPEDIRVMAVRPVRQGFHARFDALGKQYRYFVWHHPAMNPLLRSTAWHVPQPLDLPRMKQAAATFVGRHDFRSFATNRGYEFSDTKRTLTRCELRRSGPLLTFIIEGDGFLYRMCRGMVGTLIQVGRGRFGPDDIAKMLKHRDRRVAGMTAPAHGLVLWKVRYARAGREGTVVGSAGPQPGPHEPSPEE